MSGMHVVRDTPRTSASAPRVTRSALGTHLPHKCANLTTRSPWGFQQISHNQRTASQRRMRPSAYHGPAENAESRIFVCSPVFELHKFRSAPCGSHAMSLKINAAKFLKKALT